jgi:hypothetical protein
MAEALETQMDAGRPGGGRQYALFLALLVACTAGLILVGWAPTRRLGGEPAVGAMVLACLLCCVGSVVGSLPLVLSRFFGGPAGATPVGFLASLAVRFSWVVGSAAVVALAGWAEPRPFLIWVGVSYLAFLVVDVWYALARRGH